MSDKKLFDFGQFVPGFDFLKGLIPGAATAPGTPAAANNLFSNWLAPTLDSQEVQKRIEELKTVQFWLDQNGRALSATIQALEVQKLTLDTLKSMNSGAQQVAQVFQDGVVAAASTAAASASAGVNAAKASPTKSEVRQAAEQAAAEEAEAAEDEQQEGLLSEQAAEDLRIVQAQAMQWWGALSKQFQTIATHALDDMAQNFANASASIPGLSPVAGESAEAGQKAGGTTARTARTASSAATPEGQAPARKRAPRKTSATATRKTASKTTGTRKGAAGNDAAGGKEG
ncbi:hypothetical protein SAMN02745117_01257 [Lampropedia hyalina DSM 16112]|jgi:hypothetical protein|uniref:Uncharacterized protein n=1 Tax=Lampropedia hyalina DSM 16112 TaxID=1122156 RepID=A0A1M4YKH8_9BURK|nr:PhaM family polyhydroxyalkanoate granule multifunctional regulatory protein [Lampropedia hyalina]SHF06168.1 hypothetical protein SAMN02745117_01257 [Lampropedia hyalina DSM 16112]